SKARKDQARQACSGTALKLEVLPAAGERTLLVVLDPPVPGELVEVPVIADDDEPHGHDMDSVAAARLLRAVRAVERRIAGVLVPVPRLANQMAAWALEPSREANTDELAGVVAINAGRYLGRDRRKSEAIDTKLLLEPRLVDRLGMAQPRRRCPAIPLLEPGGDDGDSSSAVASSAEVDDGARSVGRDDLATTDVSQLVGHLSFPPS